MTKDFNIILGFRVKKQKRGWYLDGLNGVAVDVDVGGVLRQDPVVEPGHDVRLLHQEVDDVLLGNKG